MVYPCGISRRRYGAPAGGGRRRQRAVADARAEIALYFGLPESLPLQTLLGEVSVEPIASEPLGALLAALLKRPLEGWSMPERSPANLLIMKQQKRGGGMIIDGRTAVVSARKPRKQALHYSGKT